MPMSIREVQRFMNGERLASFATVSPSGRPHVVPVFFTYDSGKVYVQTDRKSVKVQNLLQNNNVAIAVYGGEEAVIIGGKGHIVDDDEEEFIRRTQDHIRKYQLKLDENGRDSLGIPLYDKTVRCVVEVTGEHTVFW
jgi:nitroimidazol reductase NimA-like FMN-containing flavoprotein (pyridoxamine 5'-phosphate oxidase superfamily)